MSSALKLEVIAEGVETSEQLAFLVTEGVSTIQGYIFSRPLDPDDVPAFIAGDGTR